MIYLNPAGAWAFLALGAILIFYILKRRHMQRVVPSVMLWRAALKDNSASKPFQRLRRSLVMLLQLLLAFCVAAALTHPYISTGGTAGETVIIIDNSASMRAGDRLGAARAQARALILGAAEGERFTVVASGARVASLVSRVSDKQAAVNAVSSIEPGAGGSGMDSALSLARAMANEIEGLNIVVFSDSPLEGSDVTLVSVGESEENRAVVSFAVSGDKALARVINYAKAGEIRAECFFEGELADVASVMAEAGETVSLRFDVPEGAGVYRVRLAGSDAIDIDDERYFIVSASGGVRLAMAGESDIFMEKALALRSDAEIVKTTLADAPGIEDADAFVFEGALPDELPKAGAIIAVNPPEGSELFGMRVGASAKTDGEMSAGGTLTEGLTLDNVSLRQYRPIEGGEPVLYWGADVILAYSRSEMGRAGVILSFDPHDSNLPMKYDFPVLIMNILNEIVPPSAVRSSDVAAGETAEIRISPTAESVCVTAPDGGVATVAPPFPPEAYSDTLAAGLYKILETEYSGETRESFFAVYPPIAESDVRSVSESSESARAAGAFGAGLDIAPALILLALALGLIEWRVSRRAG